MRLILNFEALGEALHGSADGEQTDSEALGLGYLLASYSPLWRPSTGSQIYRPVLSLIFNPRTQLQSAQSNSKN